MISKRWLPIALFCCMILGCSTFEPSDLNKSVSWQKAEKAYQVTCYWRGNPQENILRHDWKPWYSEVPENIYAYSAVYLPYFLGNAAMVYTKEAVLLPSAFASAGTAFQDECDDWILGHSIRYEKLFRSMWDSQDSHANYINMDLPSRNRKAHP